MEIITLKEFIKAMERGYKKAPITVNHRFYIGDVYAPDACCPNGHASLGAFDDASLEHELCFPYMQRCYNVDGQISCVAYVIDYLACAGWTTPQVIAWLKTHLND